MFMIKYSIRSMLLNFIKVDFRENMLIEKYLDLLNNGIKPSEILVLVQNSNLKKRINDTILQNIKNHVKQTLDFSAQKIIM